MERFILEEIVIEHGMESQRLLVSELKYKFAYNFSILTENPISFAIVKIITRIKTRIFY